jgi:hypothetical protein
MIVTALGIAAAFFGTVVTGRSWLAHKDKKAAREARRRSRAEPEPVAICVSRREEAEAQAVLDRVRALVPDLDLDLMQRQVHP